MKRRVHALQCAIVIVFPTFHSLSNLWVCPEGLCTLLIQYGIFHQNGSFILLFLLNLPPFYFNELFVFCTAPIFFFPLHGLASCMFTYHSCTFLVTWLHQTPRELAKQLPSAKAQKMLKMFDGENYLPGDHSHVTLCFYEWKNYFLWKLQE